MTSAKSTANSPARTVLGRIPDTKLNIANNKNTSALNSKVSIHTDTVRSKFDDIINSHSQKNALKRTATTLSSSFSDSDPDVSPKLKRARLLKMKLRLAYFKVKTNQTATPLNDLIFPQKANDVKNENKFDGKKVISSTPLSSKNKRPDLTIDKSHSIMDYSNYANDDKPFSLGIKSLKMSTMDDIVTKKAASANLKRFNREFNNNNNESIIMPLSAPPTQLTFNSSNFKSSNGITSMTSPSKFAISTYDKQSVKLPPLSKLLPSTSHNIFNNSKGLSCLTHNSNSKINDFHDTTIEERPENDKENNDSTILQNDSTSTPLPRRRHSVSQLEKSDSDLNILQGHNLVMMSTPVRQRSQQMKKSRSCNSHVQGSTVNNNNTKKNNSIIKDEDETQIMSSPTRLLSTPSSIGAAKCLLQLAHR